jgi:hypothetical protein
MASGPSCPVKSPPLCPPRIELHKCVRISRPPPKCVQLDPVYGVTKFELCPNPKTLPTCHVYTLPKEPTFTINGMTPDEMNDAILSAKLRDFSTELFSVTQRPVWDLTTED